MFGDEQRGLREGMKNVPTHISHPLSKYTLLTSHLLYNFTHTLPIPFSKLLLPLLAPSLYDCLSFASPSHPSINPPFPHSQPSVTTNPVQIHLLSSTSSPNTFHTLFYINHYPFDHWFGSVLPPQQQLIYLTIPTLSSLKMKTKILIDKKQFRLQMFF